MSNSVYVEREALKRYLVGGTDERQTLEIESHLSTCESCERTVIQLESDPDTLIDLFRVVKNDGNGLRGKAPNELEAIEIEPPDGEANPGQAVSGWPVKRLDDWATFSSVKLE